MTKEEFEYAIKSCGYFIYRGQIYYEEAELIKAFEDMGLIAQEPSGDLISRQAVMDCFKKWQPYMATRLWDFEQELSALPSINPQTCKDAISRQALLKLMGEEPLNWTDSDKELQAVEDYRNFKNMVEQLPSVKQEQKTGHCKDCKHFRKLPHHTGTLGKCIHHTGFCPKCDWYCADYETVEL